MPYSPTKPTPQEKKRAFEIYKRLQTKYPKAKIILNFQNPWQLLVAVILSAQCTDIMVNKVTDTLFPKYKRLSLKSQKYSKLFPSITSNIQEIINYALIPIHELETDIKSTGFYKNKAKSVQNAAQTILEKWNGQIPKTIDTLITVPGVGRKTANVVLGNAYGITEGIAVDTHVKKQSLRLGLTKQTDPLKIEQDLMILFEKKDWLHLTYVLIEHGRAMRFNKIKNYEVDILEEYTPKE